MSTTDEHRSTFEVNQWAGLALVIVLYLMYSSTFLTDYLMNDEWANIGLTPLDLGTAVSQSYFNYGRGLFGLYEQSVYGFVGYDPARIQFIRFLNFISITLVALCLLIFLAGRLKSAWWAWGVMLFWLSQPPVQGLMGYSLQLISNSLPSIWLSLLAFYLFFFVFDHRPLPAVLELGSIFVILMLAMQSTQTFAFFATIPVSYLALAEWANRKKRIGSFLGIMFVVLLLSTLAYESGLNVWHAQGREGYVLGEQGVGALTNQPGAVLLNALNPLAYWSVFKLWTFPYPLHNLPPLSNATHQALALGVMVVWLGVCLSSIFVELRRNRHKAWQNVLPKWLAVLLCFGLNAVFIIADAPQRIIDHRPHLALTLTGIVVFSGAYSVQVLASEYALWQNRIIKTVSLLLIILLALGAQAGVLRNMVDNHRRQIDFIRSELSTQNSLHTNTVIVVLPGRTECFAEPCGPWMGKVIDDEWHLTRPGAYRYALATIGISPADKQITFVSQRPERAPDDSIVVDWNQYLLAQVK